MKKILICWIGLTDIRASKNDESAGFGPIAQAVKARGFNVEGSGCLKMDKSRINIPCFNPF